MLSNLKQAWKIKDVRRKILYTLMMIVIFRIGCTIPVPGVNRDIIKGMVDGNGLLSLYNMFTGGAFSNFTLFALGISPYITASIIIQLLTIGFPSLEELQKSGEEGKKKINKYTKYTALGLAIIQAIGITLGIVRRALQINSVFFIVTVIITLISASMLLMWMGDKITEKGLGNGSSVIIFIGIISRIPTDVKQAIGQFETGSIALWVLIIMAIVSLLTVAAVTYIQEATRKIPVQYAKRVVGRKTYGGQNSHIPMKVNQSGVIPVIFASSLLAFPQTIAIFMGKNAQAFVTKFLSPSGEPGFWIYLVIEVILIIFFSYFYTTISFNTEDITNNMKNSGGFIPGIRPGKPTMDYLNRILSRLTLAGALFLAVIAIIPSIISKFTGVHLSLAGTSLLIVVGVALELKRQLESNLVMRSYQGFLK
ncbi:preprotein translocase subunit SecY [[Clostridium] sordellii]|uniref:Protein translocase subunit SecY n=1 Tax=Paraclostridium sordellii TaxID=1505 RepID=A0A0A1S284_PARSO|nr:MULTISPECIES: preprotein translocase subunit SecY [Paeniclostridium]MDU5019230.1 preprotein translocase subunit SecY [Clostridiales bacterium]AUN12873.1 preprotein translocase subunit SecY [Paeniclostridium sordellii]EPZ61357.1 preprotein translocase, SecY subunit [[Clostridium] sordellii VPI 9048] [Paeniclostridium sordellii VPI 9048]MBS6025591.1 preprotein translocase subunit SecY [Paeniclostridium sordellii]MBW4875448.1 preprotein translocase subunit SecY [Paeniclostridium sp.]